VAEGIEEIYDQAYGEGAETPPAESPAAQTEETELEPAAEGEPGVEQAGESGEEKESSVPEHVPYDRFQEVIHDRNQLKQKAEAYETLLKDPRVRAAAQEAYRQGFQPAPAAPEQTRQEKLLARLDAINPEELTENELALYETLMETRDVLAQTHGRVQSFEQRTYQEQVQTAQQQFQDTLGELSTSAGVELSDEQVAKVMDTAANIEAGMLARFGRQPDVTEVTRMAFAAVVPAARTSNAEAEKAKQAAEAERQRQVQEQKRRTVSGRPAGTGGPSGSGTPVPMSAQEAAERAYRETYGE
jgi:hypothetical protein